MIKKLHMYCIEDIYFCEVNTKYISSSVLKTSKFSRVCSTSENSEFFNSLDEIYSVFRVKVFRTKGQRIVCDRIPESIEL